MLTTIIQNYDLSDIKRELKRFLDEGSKSPVVRELALGITKQTPYNNNQIELIYDFVKTNIKYQPDPRSTELFVAPWVMVEFYNKGIAAGDCDDLSLITGSLLLSIGYNARLVLLDTNGEGFSHCIAQVYSDKVSSWINLDTSSRVPLGWEEKYYNKIIIEAS